MRLDNQKKLIKDAIKEYRQDEAKENKNKIYHNTELLMKHYNELKQHADNAIYKISGLVVEDCNDEYETAMTAEYEKLYISSILKSKLRTTIMVLHIEMALELLKENAYRDGDDEKYTAFIEIYTLGKSYDELADQLHCAAMTVRRWKKEMINRLSILLFGGEGLPAIYLR